MTVKGPILEVGIKLEGEVSAVLILIGLFMMGIGLGYCDLKSKIVDTAGIY